jgi:hypothetical protein
VKKTTITLALLALLLSVAPAAAESTNLSIAGNDVHVSYPDGWEMFNENPDDYYFVWSSGDEEMIGMINLYSGEDYGVSNDAILGEYGGDEAAMLDAMMEALVGAIENASGDYELRFGSYEKVGSDPAYYASIEYYDNWDGIAYYNLDTMYLYAGQIYYQDAFCLVEKESVFKNNVLGFIDGLSFH